MVQFFNCQAGDFQRARGSCCLHKGVSDQKTAERMGKIETQLSMHSFKHCIMDLFVCLLV